jgi:branched-chain amino acid transport system permease protein
MIMMFFYGYLSVSWNILAGYAGQLSIGHSAFLGVGSYTLAFLFIYYRISPWIGIWIGGIMGTFVGLLIGIITFRWRLKEIYFALATLAFSIILGIIVRNWMLFGGSVGLVIPWEGTLYSLQFKSKAIYYYMILGMVICSIIIVFFLKQSKLGYYFMCVRENEEVAMSLGINILRTKLKAIGISSFLTAIAGGFHAIYFLHTNPDEDFGIMLSIAAIMPAILGGMGTILGPIIGSFILTPLNEVGLEFLSGGKFSGLHMVVYGSLLILTIIYMPRGVIYYLSSIFRGK